MCQHTRNCHTHYVDESATSPAARTQRTSTRNEGPCEHFSPSSHGHLSTQRIAELVDGQLAAHSDISGQRAADVVVAMRDCNVLARAVMALTNFCC